MSKHFESLTSVRVKHTYLESGYPVARQQAEELEREVPACLERITRQLESNEKQR